MVWVTLISSCLYLCLRYKKNFHYLQQNFYNENNRYIKWGIKNIFEVFKFDIIMLILSTINLYLNNQLLSYGIGIYLILLIVEINNIKKEQVKIPLKITSRIKRLVVTNILLYFIIYIYYFISNNIFVFSLLNSLFVSLNFFIIWLSNVINKPIEKLVFIYYKNKAISKLNGVNDLKVIGITGSYGKTSSKNILSNILNAKYNSLATPGNFNTQYGLIITINNKLDKFTDIFIAEMGAFKRGRIKLLCDLVKPTYGIITNIGTAHLETFGSRENIQEGKFELIESLPKDGVGILNIDDPYQVSYKLKNNCKIIWIGINNKEADVYAENIKMTEHGMDFDVFFKNEAKKYFFTTKLLGYANIYNILAGIALGKHLKMDISELQRGVKQVETVEHRLEIKKLPNKIIIDDAYNSNPVGSKMALDVLNLMDGYKVVVTPGMIELGEEQYNLNKQFGEYISEVADEVILVGKNQTKPVLEGLIDKKYNQNKITIINDVKEAFKIIDNIETKKKKFVLLENDLPDIFNEK